MGLHEVKQFAAMQLDSLRRRRADIDREIAEIEKMLGMSHEDKHAHAEGTYTAEITAAIHDVLVVAEAPLHRNEILAALEESEFFVSGKDKLGALSAYLSRDERFTSVGRGRWALTNAVNNTVDGEWSDLVRNPPYQSSPLIDGNTLAILDEQGISGNNAA